MKVTYPSEEELEVLSNAYDGLSEWAQNNGLDGRHTLGLLMKAAMMLGVTNKVPKEELLEVADLTYEMEKFIHPISGEMH